MAPRVKPAEIIIMTNTRRRCGLNSPHSAMALGMMAPSPRPVMKRMTASCHTLVASGVTSMLTAKKKVDHTSTGRRPTLSATTLSTSEPISKPNRPAPNTGPMADFSMPHSCRMAGAT